MALENLTAIEDTLRETVRLEDLLISCIGNYERIHLERVETSHEEAAGEKLPLSFSHSAIIILSFR
jgi:hypothetical protein